MDTPALPLPPTKEQAYEAWLSERRTYIGGSDLYHLFNIPQYGKGCARWLGYVKSGVKPTHEDPTPDDEALLRRGKMLEPFVADLYEEQTGRKVRRPAMDKFGFGRPVRHPDLPFLAVNTDRVILAGHGGVKDTGALEIKTHGEGLYFRILREGAPPGHSLQIQMSLMIWKWPWGSLGMLGIFGSMPLRYADTEANLEVHDKIARTSEVFWNNLQKGILPEPLPDEDDLRCEVCMFRLECRRRAVNFQALTFQRRQASDKTGKTLWTVTDAELLKQIKALALLKQELKAISNDNEDEPGAIQILERQILSRLAELGIGKDHKPYIPGLGTLSLVPTQFNGLDQKRLKIERREVWDEFYVASRYTGNLSLRLHLFK